MNFFDKTRLWVRLRRARLHVAYDNGIESEELPVVMLHGIASSSRDYVLVEKLIPDTRRVVMLDLLGYGKSPIIKNCSYTIDDHLQVLHRTLRVLGIRKAVFVGYSMGALISIAYGARYGAARHVVACSMPLYAYEDSSNFWHKLTNLFYARITSRQTVALRLAIVVKFFAAKRSGFNLNHTTWHSFYNNVQNIVAAYNPLEDAKEVGSITLIAGHLDPFVSLRAVRQFARDADIKDIQIVNAVLHTMNAEYAQKIIAALNAVVK